MKNRQILGPRKRFTSTIVFSTGDNWSEYACDRSANIDAQGSNRERRVTILYLQVCEDLVKMINEEARVLDDEGAENSGHDPIYGSDDGAAAGSGGAKMDYSKPFKLFDEQGLGVIPVDQFRCTVPESARFKLFCFVVFPSPQRCIEARLCML